MVGAEPSYHQPIHHSTRHRQVTQFGVCDIVGWWNDSGETGQSWEEGTPLRFHLLTFQLNCSGQVKCDFITKCLTAQVIQRRKQRWKPSVWHLLCGCFAPPTVVSVPIPIVLRHCEPHRTGKPDCQVCQPISKPKSPGRDEPICSRMKPLQWLLAAH